MQFNINQIEFCVNIAPFGMGLCRSGLVVVIVQRPECHSDQASYLV